MADAVWRSFNPGLASYLIGGSIGPAPNLTPKIGHQIWFKTATRGDVVYAVAGVRLFAAAGTPEYDIVVGQITNWPAAQQRLGLA
jgi:hypothetical protein